MTETGVFMESMKNSDEEGSFWSRFLAIRVGTERNYLDKSASAALKGVAILLMLFHHMYRKPSMFDKYGLSFAPFEQANVVDFAIVCKICVSIFAFISGYGLYLSYSKFDKAHKSSQDMLKWSAARYFKTIAGFQFVYILCVIFCSLMENWQDNPNPEYIQRIFFEDNKPIYGRFLMLIDFLGLANLFGTHMLCNAWWYMSAAVVYGALTPFIYKYQKRWGMATALILAFVIPRVLQIRSICSTNSILGFLFIFMIGMAFAKSGAAQRWICGGQMASIPAKICKFVGEIWLIHILNKLYVAMPEKKFWEIQWALLPTVVILFLCEFVVWLPIVRSILSFIGRHATNIFLIHLFIKTIYFKSFIYDHENFLTGWALLLVISLGVSVIIEGIKRIIRFDSGVKWIYSKILCIGDSAEKNEMKNEKTRETEKFKEKQSV